jgi:very-short-patch-repair endonuclease
VSGDHLHSPGLSDPSDAGHPDRLLAGLAARQSGVVARRQLMALGVSETVIRARLRRRLLVRLHRGVYAVGHAQLRREGHWFAAVLAAGDGAVLSHRDAAALHLLRPNDRERIDVTTSGRAASTTAIVVHQTTVLTGEDVTAIGSIRLPVTTVARTLVDLAGVVPPSQLARALSQAEQLNELDVAAIERALDRTRERPGRGHRTMRAALADHRAAGAQLTRPELEDRFAQLLAAVDAPRPRRNATVAGVEVDAYGAEQRLVVELDGYAYHHTRRAFQRDRSKTNDLTLAGFTVLRFTHRDIVLAPDGVADRVARALSVGESQAARWQTDRRRPYAAACSAQSR